MNKSEIRRNIKKCLTISGDTKKDPIEKNHEIFEILHNIDKRLSTKQK